MKLLLVVLFCLIFFNQSFSQSNHSFIVKAGSNMDESIPMTELYQYPDFVQGKVFFKDGSASEAKLNYSRFLDEMQFINPKGDTLAIANELLIKLISIGKDSFYYDEGYIKLLKSSNDIKLGLRHVLKISDVQKMAAYDMTSSTSSIKSVNSFTGRGRFYKLNVKEDVLIMKEEKFYFGDKFNHFVLANKKNVLGLLPKHQEAIKKYLKENTVEFHKQADLEKLFQFLEVL